jgi:hypothetical protein
MQVQVQLAPSSMFGHGLRYNTFTVLIIQFGLRRGAGVITRDGIVHGDRLHGHIMILSGLLIDHTIQFATGIVLHTLLRSTGHIVQLR